MKILVIAESINIEDSSGSKANVALIQSLLAAGFILKVLHYTRKTIEISGVECVAIQEKKWNFLYFLSRSQRIFTRLTGININPFIENFLGFSFSFFNDTNSIAKSLRKEKIFKPNLVLTLSKGASFRPHYALLKCPELHQQWLAYVHDPYPFHYYPRPYNWVEPGFRKKEAFFRSVSEKAAFSAFPSLLLKEWMGSYFPNFLVTGIVIPHQSVAYEIKNKEFPSYFKTDKFSILHAGNLMKQRSPKALLEGFLLFLKNNPEVKEKAKLYIIGPAQFHEELLETYKSEQNIYIENASIPFDEIYNLQMNVNVNVILESKAEISPFLPAKFPHCIDAKKSILLLSPYYSETRRLLGDNYPFWSEVDDVEKIAELIQKLYFERHSENETIDFTKLKSYLGNNFFKNTLLNLKR